MYMMKKFIILLLTLGLISCGSSDDSNNNGGDGFNRGALLSNIADSYIIPALQDLDAKLSAMNTAKNNFVNDKTQANLDALSIAWLEAYKTWQHVEMFDIGQAEALNKYLYFMNIYPTNITDINNVVASGNYDLTMASLHDAQGFPAIDYLIHSDGSLERFTTDVNATAYESFLTALVDRMQNLTTQVLNDWQNSYRDAFVANTSSSSTGSLDKMVNDFIFFYEKGFRTNKIGIPAGSFSGSPAAEKVEAFYKKDVSKTLAIKALTAIEDVFEGKAYNGSSTGESFKTYLAFLDENEIVTSIEEKFNNARTTLNNLPDNFYQQVLDDNTTMTGAFDVIQTAVPILKVDMASAMDVSIDYVDADGD
jgi:hypothetical protein